MRRYLHGFDEIVVETLYISVSALIGIVVLSYLLNSSTSHKADGIPLVGQAIDGARALVGQVTQH